MVPLDKELQWVNVKQKPLRQIIGTIKHIQAYSEPCVTLVSLDCGIPRTLIYSEPEAYSEPWHVHISGIFRNPIYYSERWHIQNPRHIQDPVIDLQ